MANGDQAWPLGRAGSAAQPSSSQGLLFGRPTLPFHTKLRRSPHPHPSVSSPTRTGRTLLGSRGLIAVPCFKWSLLTRAAAPATSEQSNCTELLPGAAMGEGSATGARERHSSPSSLALLPVCGAGRQHKEMAQGNSTGRWRGHAARSAQCHPGPMSARWVLGAGCVPVPWHWGVPGPDHQQHAAPGSL